MEWVHGRKGRLARISLTLGSPDCNMWLRWSKEEMRLKGWAHACAVAPTLWTHLPQLFLHCWLWTYQAPSSLPVLAAAWMQIGIPLSWLLLDSLPHPLICSLRFYLLMRSPLPSLTTRGILNILFLPSKSSKGAGILWFLPHHWCTVSAQKGARDLVTSS